jgi:hypothetical protein
MFAPPHSTRQYIFGKFIMMGAKSLKWPPLTNRSQNATASGLILPNTTITFTGPSENRLELIQLSSAGCDNSCTYVPKRYVNIIRSGISLFSATYNSCYLRTLLVSAHDLAKLKVFNT